jgi:hypothetical protein
MALNCCGKTTLPSFGTVRQKPGTLESARGFLQKGKKFHISDGWFGADIMNLTGRQFQISQLHSLSGVVALQRKLAMRRSIITSTPDRLFLLATAPSVRLSPSRCHPHPIG